MRVQFKFNGRGLMLGLTLAGMGLLAGGAVSALQAQSSSDTIPNKDEYVFLRLGVDRDYLADERHRIIDQLEQSIPPLYEPRTPFHGFTLPPGAMRIGITGAYGHNPGDFGTDDFYSLFFDEVEVDFTTVALDFAYGFEFAGINDLVVRATLPYKIQRTEGTGHPFRIDPMVMTMNGAAEGLGDITVTIKKKWLDQGNGPVTFSTMLGAIFPTAQDDQAFNAAQTLFMGPMTVPVMAGLPGNPGIDVFGRNPGDLLHPRSAQPGNGSWGARVGFGLTRQLERSALHIGAVYDILADNDGITPGNELRYGASWTVPLLPSDRVTFDLAVTGFWKGDEQFPGTIMHPERDPATGGPMMDGGGNIMMFQTARPDFKHGNITFASPTIVLLAAPNVRLFAGPSIRLIEPEKGPSPRWSFTVGQSYTF